MKNNRPSREDVVAAIRRAVEAAGGKRISFRQFRADSGMKREDVLRVFTGWEKALEAGGFGFKHYNAIIGLEELLSDWGAVARRLGRAPTRAEYKVDGKFNPRRIEMRLDGRWSTVPGAFARFAADKTEWQDVPALVVAQIRDLGQAKHPKSDGKHQWKTTRRRRLANRAICGEPLNFESMRHEPVNESGVVVLFAMAASRMGFLIEAMNPNFPDCEARRRLAPGRWQSIRIEFEYESRNFRDHAHDPEGCDLIVCWEHNWPECPVEVLALKDEIRELETRI
jgi:hypothetical protein